MLGSAHHRLALGANLIRLAVCRTAPGADILRPEQMRLLDPAYTLHSLNMPIPVCGKWQKRSKKQTEPAKRLLCRLNLETERRRGLLSQRWSAQRLRRA